MSERLDLKVYQYDALKTGITVTVRFINCRYIEVLKKLVTGLKIVSLKTNTTNGST